MKKSKYLKVFLFGIFFSAFLTSLIYISFRLITYILADILWYERILAAFLLMAELFLVIHTIGYFLNVYHVMSYVKTDVNKIRPLTHYPPVAIVVCSYKEPLPILEDTLICFYNLSYPNKHLYFLDDTRYELKWDTPENIQKYRNSIEELCKNLGINLFRAKWHGAKAGILNDFIQFIKGNPPDSLEYTYYDNREKSEAEKYLVVFDADSNPLPDFVEPLVAQMENNPKACFIQTPQYYSNFEFNRVARASGLQQAIFYEYICEGKGLKNTVFCCGTNVLLRIEALNSVGGYDEESVTEDIMTSLRMHMKGWESLYSNRVSAFGMGPEDLGAYFKQQSRWSRGTIGLLMDLPREIIKNYPVPFRKCWEYFLSGSHYLVGWVFFIMMICPVIYLLWRVPTFFANPTIYFLAYTPYVIITMAVFLWTLKIKKYRLLDLASALLINMISFPVYMRSSVDGILNRKSSFTITPKTGSTILPFKDIWPQVGLAILCIAAVTWGIQRLIYERTPFMAIFVNILWTFFNFIVLSFIIYFNHSEEEQKK